MVEVEAKASLASLQREHAALEHAFKETEETLGTEEELATNYENAREHFLLQKTRIKKLQAFQKVCYDTTTRSLPLLCLLTVSSVGSCSSIAAATRQL